MNGTTRVMPPGCGQRPSVIAARCDAHLPVAEEIVQLGPDFDFLRWSLLPSEIERYQALAREVADGLETACRAVRPGDTEYQLASRIAAPLLAAGIRTPVVLVAADDRVRNYRHPLPTARKFAKYGMGVCSAERGGLIVSCTRLFSFGPSMSNCSVVIKLSVRSMPP